MDIPSVTIATASLAAHLLPSVPAGMLTREACMQVFCIQFYLGTTRLQLEHKGDDRHHYTNFANVIVSFGFVVIPLIGWLLDHKGYGVTMGTINCIGVICSVLEAIPSLRLQVRMHLLALCFQTTYLPDRMLSVCNQQSDSWYRSECTLLLCVLRPLTCLIRC